MIYDVIVIGGGQSGLAVGYYLRRTGLSFVILDRAKNQGGSWQNHWKSLRLFSPAQWSSLPGVIMPGGSNYYPTRDETIRYLQDYEEKYQLPLIRPVTVESVEKENEIFQVKTKNDIYRAHAIVSSTGSFENPNIPKIADLDKFKGKIVHSSQYVEPIQFKNKRIAIIGEGNSGAQILAEISKVGDIVWVTQKEPRFLPDHVDGRYLFDAATQMYEAKKQGKAYTPPSLGDIVMVPPVKEAKERGFFKKNFRPFQRFGVDSLIWDNGHEEKVDAIIFCTGFKPSLNHLQSLNAVNKDGRVDTVETRATYIDGLWLVGYGNWTGFASATLIGVGRSAKTTVDEIVQYVAAKRSKT